MIPYVENLKRDWWDVRRRAARSAPDVTTKILAWAELLAMPLSLITLFLLGLQNLGLPIPGWFSGRLMICLSCGAVGYLTNALAIAMLFHPLRPTRFFLWRQGLIPRKQPDLAKAAGQLVGETLLSPEALAKEIADVADRALDDPKVRRQIQTALAQSIQEDIPHVVERILARQFAGKNGLAWDLLKGGGPALARGLGQALAANQDLIRVLEEEGVFVFQRRLRQWILEEGTQTLRDHADVAGRVRATVESLSPELLQRTIQHVAAQHLGAIQVLGYFAGAALGLLLGS